MRQQILLIEDETELAQMIRNYLLKEQYSVVLCHDGAAALAAFREYRPQLVILDLMLPGKDGLELLREIRSQSSVPVIIISAKETEFDRILGLKLGADDYLTKPFSIKELVARTAALFRRAALSQTACADQWQFRDISLDPAARIVKRGDQSVNLTAKEFDLLFFLTSHPRQVLTKEQIYQQVWGFDEFGDLNTVVIHVQKLREKLGEGHDIVTVRGIGYRFDGELL